MIRRLLLRISRLVNALLNRTLNTKEKEFFRCPCCGCTPCDCDDH